MSLPPAAMPANPRLYKLFAKLGIDHPSRDPQNVPRNLGAHPQPKSDEIFSKTCIGNPNQISGKLFRKLGLKTPTRFRQNFFKNSGWKSQLIFSKTFPKTWVEKFNTRSSKRYRKLGVERPTRDGEKIIGNSVSNPAPKMPKTFAGIRGAA